MTALYLDPCIDTNSAKLIHDFEEKHDLEYAPSISDLICRFSIFPKGNYLIKKSNALVGCINWCLTSNVYFNSFLEVGSYDSFHDPKGSFMFLYNIIVNEDNRRHGIGSFAIKESIKEISPTNDCYLASPIHNCFFYEELGFCRLRELRKFAPERGTYYLMRRDFAL